MLQIRPHQQLVLDDPRKRFGIFFGTGAFKTSTALLKAKGKTLVVVPKMLHVSKRWEQEVEKWGIEVDMTVVSMEIFKDIKKVLQLPKYDTLIIDEAHNFFGVQPEMHQVKKKYVPKMSHMFKNMYYYIQENNIEYVYTLTATPVPRKKPMRLWAANQLLGGNWDYEQFRDVFYKKVPTGKRTKWGSMQFKYEPNLTPQLIERRIRALQSTGHVFNTIDLEGMSEPIQKTEYIELSVEQKSVIKKLKDTETSLSVMKMKRRQIENGIQYIDSINEAGNLVRTCEYYTENKTELILRYYEEFKKVIVFCNYTSQIGIYKNKFEKEGIQVFTITGSSKDKDTVIESANNCDDCIIIIQCGVSAGYQLQTFRCMIFASKSYKELDYIQAIGRNNRGDNPQANTIIHLVVSGGPDEACHNSIMSGVDYQEQQMINV